MGKGTCMPCLKENDMYEYKNQLTATHNRHKSNSRSY